MLVLKIVFLAVASVTLVLGVCGGGGDKPSEQAKAFQLAITQAGDDPNSLPPLGATYDCTIFPQRQPPAPQSPLRAVAAKCLWNIEPQGGSWLATFRETWLCSDWSAEAESFPPCDSITGFHEWEYLVNVPSGTVDILSSRGQFAPDM